MGLRRQIHGRSGLERDSSPPPLGGGGSGVAADGGGYQACGDRGIAPLPACGGTPPNGGRNGPRKTHLRNLSTAGCAQGSVDCCGYVENRRSRELARPIEHQVTSAAASPGTLQPKTGWLNRRPILRIVNRGWPKVPEQQYLVRGSAGTGCKGNLGHPLVHGPIESMSHESRVVSRTYGGSQLS